MLTISNLTKTYDNGVKALDGVDLIITKGMFGLLGPNGAGKSSLMRTIAALQSADSGSIVFNGIDVLADPQALRKTLGYLPQDFNVYPRISAYDLLDHLAILKGINQSKLRKEAVEGLLAHTNLYQHKNKAVSGFSGGMRQRFGIAQALLGDPKLLIVDEPTAGLDPEERNRFHNLLVSLGEEKVVILSTHIVEDVSELCANMAVLASGKILLQGNPHQLVSELTEKIWTKTVNQAQALELETQLPVISKRLLAGRTVLNVMAETCPEGFIPATAGLEDLYFSTLHSHRRQAA
ncbi:ABC transporter ATP-binding protein [Shewanella morhuae]|uniref:ABC transporter ATP-binding protein n=1 Tax=Shewanella morhuae TaxID=365591 RepID=A0ABX5HWX2_9GAMM|nr:ABC transporter ATP-binding protein [Shewanella morhuae]PTA50642.1 ABC transporter ATP-binding protein [Shewanella morhuae]SIR12335.1 ABC-type multidrug transport system, ATPase component [Shewanella morhuae]